MEEKLPNIGGVIIVRPDAIKQEPGFSGGVGVVTQGVQENAAPKKPVPLDTTVMRSEAEKNGMGPKTFEKDNIFQQDDQGNITINLPKDATVGIAREGTPLPGKADMFLVSLTGVIEKLRLSREDFERVTFKAQEEGVNRITYINAGENPHGPEIHVKSEGAKIKNEKIDVEVNGRMQSDQGTSSGRSPIVIPPSATQPTRSASTQPSDREAKKQAWREEAEERREEIRKRWEADSQKATAERRARSSRSSSRSRGRRYVSQADTTDPRIRELGKEHYQQHGIPEGVRPSDSTMVASAGTNRKPGGLDEKARDENLAQKGGSNKVT